MLIRAKETVVAKTARNAGGGGTPPTAPEDLDPAQEALFREVEEDLRAEQMRKLWQRFGGYVIGAAVLVVAVVAGFQGWTAWQASVRADEAERFYAAVEGTGPDDPGARAALGALAADGRTGYATLAALRNATALARDGETAAAIAAYDALSGDGGLPVPVRDLAAMLAALYAMDEEPAGSIRGRLTPLTADDSPWRFMALEMLARLDLREGDMATAVQVFADLSQNRNAPTGVRARASEMLAMIGHGPGPGVAGGASEPDAGG
jgi:hypothetical protein